MRVTVSQSRFLAVLGVSILSATGTFQAQDAKMSKISMEDARKSALAAENGKIKSEELEKEKGKQIYSFDIAMPDGLHEVNIDAATGKLMEDTIENAKDEAKEAAADAKAAKAKKAAAKKATAGPQ